MTASHDLGWVLVAGGSGGVGGAVCRSLADDGWHVALTCHRNADAAERGDYTDELITTALRNLACR